MGRVKRNKSWALTRDISHIAIANRPLHIVIAYLIKFDTVKVFWVGITLYFFLPLKEQS